MRHYFILELDEYTLHSESYLLYYDTLLVVVSTLSTVMVFTGLGKICIPRLRDTT